MIFKLAEAVVDVSIDRRKFDSGLAGVQASLNAFAARNAAIKIGLPTAQFVAFNSAVRNLNASMAAGTPIARAYAAALAAAGAAGAPAIRAMGAANAASVRAYGAALGSAAAGVGTALGNAAAGFGQGLKSALQGTGSPIAALGAGLGMTARGFGAGLQSAARGFASIIGSVLGGGAGLLRSLMGSGGIAGMRPMGGMSMGFGSGGGAVGEAAELETLMVRLARATGMEGRQLDDLGSKLKRFSSNMAGVHLADVFGIATMGARMGVESNALDLFTRDVAKMSAIFEDTELPTRELAERIASLLTVFHRGPSDTARFAAAMNKLDLMSVASARDILEVTSRFSATAATFGMKPQQALALSTALRQAKVPIETAGTNMAQVMGRMGSARDMGGFAKIAGMGKKQFGATLQGDPLTAIRAVLEGLKRISEQKGPIAASQALDKLHIDGQRARQMLLSLVQVLPQLDKYLDASNEEWSTMDQLNKSFNLTAKTTESQLKLLWNNIKLTASAIGEHLLPAVKMFSTGVGILLRDVARYVESNRETLASWGKSIADTLSYVSLAWRRFPLVVEFGTAVIAEKWNQIQEIGGRLKTGLTHIFTALGRTLGDLAKSIGDHVGARLANAITSQFNALIAANPWAAKQFGLKAVAALPVPPVVGNAAQHFGQAAANIRRDLPNGVFGNLPRDPRLMGGAFGGGLGIAGGGQFGGLPRRLNAARDAVVGERNAANAADDDQDAATRAAEEAARRPRPAFQPPKRPLELWRMRGRIDLEADEKQHAAVFQGKQFGVDAEDRANARRAAILRANAAMPGVGRAPGLGVNAFDRAGVLGGAIGARMLGMMRPAARDRPVGGGLEMVAALAGGAGLAGAVGGARPKAKLTKAQQIARGQRLQRVAAIQQQKRERANFNRAFWGKPPLGEPGGGPDKLLPPPKKDSPEVKVLKEVVAKTGEGNGKLDSILAAIQKMNPGLA